MSQDQFEVFWRAYPRRISKGDARRKFATAIKKTDLMTMLDAVERYKASKPTWMDFKHPATWLHQECWCDEWEQPSHRPQSIMEAGLSLMRGINAENSGDYRALELLPPASRH